jgi:hypothetical protein
MLIEISCDAFESYGKSRPPIVFRKGLNTILGDHAGSNSIGKSTFLLIVDFAFGGDDYAKSDAVRHVGTHTINFKYEFDGHLFYFSRETLTPERVNVCDENYNAQGEPLTIKQFREKLFELYRIGLTGISFRDILGRYFRVYGRDNLSERRPLLAAARESDEKAITALLRLFGKYGRFEELKSVEQESIARRNAFKEAQKYEFVPFGITTKKQFSENESRIVALRNELDSLAEQTDKKLSADDLQQADVASELKGKLTYARRQRGRLKSQLRAMEANMGQGVLPTEEDISDLSRFFPQVDTKTIGQIEHFHVLMHNVLTDEFEDERQRLSALIESADKEIAALEAEQRKLGIPAKLPKTFLDRYTELSGRIRALEKQNEAYTKLLDLKDEVKSVAARLVEVQEQELRFLQSDINNKMAKLNDYIYDGTHKPPILDLKSVKSYVFETPDDTGTGTSYKSLVVFDLSVLELTPLPALAHDSLILKNIGDAPIERIMELYLRTQKQVFIALDKDDSYTERTSVILNETAVLQLSGDGNQLFGRSWNNK